MNPARHAAICAEIQEHHGKVVARLRARIAELERAALAAQPAEPVEWRDHVERRIREWRHRMMNADGDRLSLDDYMGQDAIDDLVDYVCDESAAPAAVPTYEQVAVNEDEVICPNCCAQFRAIPGSVQRLMLDAGFEPPFTAAPAAVPPEPLTEDQVWANYEIMALNATMQLLMPVIMDFIRAIERAHGIGDKP